MVNRYRPMRQNPTSTRMCSIAAPSKPYRGQTRGAPAGRQPQIRI